MRQAAVIAVVNLVLLELFAFAAYSFNIFGLDERFYDSYFDLPDPSRHTTVSGDIPRNIILGTSPGWDLKEPDNARSAPDLPAQVCGSTFGGSLVYADEVSDDKAWPFLLSQKLGCKIANYGVWGYGLDQAYLKFQGKHDLEDLVLIGVDGEMLRRNLAGSWKYLANYKVSPPKPYFVLDGGRLKLMSASGVTDTAKNKQHHQHDRYYSAFEVRFPYAYFLTRALYKQMQSETMLIITDHREPYLDEGSVELALAILREWTATGSHRKYAIVLFPLPESVEKGVRPYVEFKDVLKAKLPGPCIIDLYDELRAGYEQAGKTFITQDEHYDPGGNAIIANAIYEGLDACRDLPGQPRSSAHDRQMESRRDP